MQSSNNEAPVTHSVEKDGVAVAIEFLTASIMS